MFGFKFYNYFFLNNQNSLVPHKLFEGRDGLLGETAQQTEWRDDPNLKKLEEKSERRGEGEEDREGQERRGERGGAVSENRS